MKVHPRDLHGRPSERAMRTAWWAPLLDQERHERWAVTRSRFVSAIQEARRRHGFETPEHSVLGEYLYANARTRATVRRAS